VFFFSPSFLLSLTCLLSLSKFSSARASFIPLWSKFHLAKSFYLFDFSSLFAIFYFCSVLHFISTSVNYISLFFVVAPTCWKPLHGFCGSAGFWSLLSLKLLLSLCFYLRRNQQNSDWFYNLRCLPEGLTQWCFIKTLVVFDKPLAFLSVVPLIVRYGSKQSQE
jgi:hypothetical protein